MEVREESLARMVEELELEEFSPFWIPVWNITSVWLPYLDEYGFFVELFLEFVYFIYGSFDSIQMIMFMLKVIPTLICMHQFIKNVYVPSRERIKQKHMELKELQLQVELMRTRMSCQDAELEEQAAAVRAAVRRLQDVRARARDLLAGDEALSRSVYEDNGKTEESQDDCEFLLDLIKQFKYDRPEVQNRMDCGEPQNELGDNSANSSLSNADSDQGFRVKIVKVTNVYKLSYLKQYIKRKRMKRTSKQADLNKKMDDMMQLLKHWQKTLTMVSQTRLPMKGEHFEMSSQDGMGDFRPSLRDSSGSDSDRNREIDSYLAVAQGYSGYYSEDDPPPPPAPAPPPRYLRCECNCLCSLPEETRSQLQIAFEKDEA